MAGADKERIFRLQLRSRLAAIITVQLRSLVVCSENSYMSIF